MYPSLFFVSICVSYIITTIEGDKWLVEIHSTDLYKNIDSFIQEQKKESGLLKHSFNRFFQ